MTLEERKITMKDEIWEAKQSGTEEPTKAMTPQQMQRAWTGRLVAWWP